MPLATKRSLVKFKVLTSALTWTKLGPDVICAAHTRSPGDVVSGKRPKSWIKISDTLLGLSGGFGSRYIWPGLSSVSESALLVTSGISI